MKINVLKTLKTNSGKCDDHQKIKYIFEDAMVFTLKAFNDESPISPMASTPVKKPSDIKSLYPFTNILDVKRKTATLQVGSAKFKRKIIKYGTIPCALKQKRKGNSKINDKIKKSLYIWIMNHS